MKRVQPNQALVNLKDLQGRGEALTFTEGSQWLEVVCETCGPLAYGTPNETEAADELQRSHAKKRRGHRVNLELFFREVVHTHIELHDDPEQLDRN